MPPDLVAKLMLLMTLMTARRPSLPGQQPDTLQQEVHRLGTAAAPYGYPPATLSGSSTAFTDRAAAAKLLHNTIRQVLADTGAAAPAPFPSPDTNGRSTLSRRRLVGTYIRGTAGHHVTRTSGSGAGSASGNVNSNASLIPSKDYNTTMGKPAATKIKNDTDATTIDTSADSDRNNTLVDSNTAAITVNASTNTTLVKRNDTFTPPYSSINVTSPSSSATVAHSSTGHAPADNTRAATVVSFVNATRPDRRTVITQSDATPNARQTINTNATFPPNNTSVAPPDINADVTLTNSSNTRNDSNTTNTLPHTGLTNATSSESDAKAKPSGDNITATDITFNATLSEKNHTTPTATSIKGSRPRDANVTQPDNNVHLAVTNEANLSLPGRNITLALTSNIKVTLKGGNITVELTDSNVIAKAASTDSSASPTGNDTDTSSHSNATVATTNTNTTLPDNSLTVALTNDTNAIFPGSSFNETQDDNDSSSRPTGNIRNAQAEDVLAFPSGGSFSSLPINDTNNWTGSKPNATHTESNSLSKSAIPQILFKSLSTFSNILHRNRSINDTNVSHLLTTLMKTNTRSKPGESGAPAPPTERQANQTLRDTDVITSSQNSNVEVTLTDRNSTDEVTSYTVAAPPITSNASETTMLPHRDTSGTGANAVTDSTLASTSARGTTQTDNIEVVEFDSVSTTTIARSATTYELPERERNPAPRDYEDIEPDAIMTETSTRTTHFHRHYDPVFDEDPMPPHHVNWEGLYYTTFADLIPLNAIRTPLDELSTDTHSCNRVREVPEFERRQLSLSTFYQRYTEAYGIPVLASSDVPDAALRRACYIVRFLFADHRSLRDSYRQRRGRVAVIGRNERTTQIPEHRTLGSAWDQRARGLGATDNAPICTIGEENLLRYGYPADRWYSEDIGLHEFAHGLHLLGAKYAWPEWTSRLKAAYKAAQTRGLWQHTYAGTNDIEYFAEGMQKYFSVEAYSRYPNGIHNHVDTKEKLRYYDPRLYELIEEMFPCENTYISRRSDGFKTAGDTQKLRLTFPKCLPEGEHRLATTTTQRPRTTTAPPTTTARPTPATAPPAAQVTNKPCTDEHKNCRWWARSGYCYTNTGYMTVSCRQACGLCGSCRDRSSRCREWAGKGECKNNPGYMLFNCRTSCGKC